MELNFFFLNGRGDADSTKGGGRGDPCPVNQARAVIGGSKGKVGQGLGSPTLAIMSAMGLRLPKFDFNKEKKPQRLDITTQEHWKIS